ncbi:hypothetical protein ASC74_10120 [Pseudomonas sp. Root329]|nr:hypothetical protein ASC74_10120 [Pseudomonas sp. Root329]
MVITSSLICSYIGATSSIVVERDLFGQLQRDGRLESLGSMIISWIPRPVFQLFELAMNISLIPFLLENRPGSTQEIAESVEL